MPRKLTTAQPTFRILVANLSGGSDPSRGTVGNPVKIRQQFEMQHFPEIPGRRFERGAWDNQLTPGISTKVGLLAGRADPWTPQHADGQITVANNDFSAHAHIILGDYELISGEHFTIGGSVNDTATNLAATISLLDGFTAQAVLAVVSILGPIGPDGNAVRFEASYEGAVQNFNLVPNDGSMTDADPYIGPVAIT